MVYDDPDFPASSSASIPRPRPPLARQVADQLRDAIVRGELAPGERVVERKLATRFEVSRTPFREALKILEGEGLVTIALNRGARVCAVTPGVLEDLFDVLSGLEGLAAARAATRMAGSEMKQLEDLHAHMVSAYRDGDRDTYFALNSAIHDLVVTASRNLALITAREKLVGQATRGRYLAIGDGDRWHRSVLEHEALMTALRSGAAEEASRVWARHLKGTGERLHLNALARCSDLSSPSL